MNLQKAKVIIQPPVTPALIHILEANKIPIGIVIDVYVKQSIATKQYKLHLSDNEWEPPEGDPIFTDFYLHYFLQSNDEFILLSVGEEYDEGIEERNTKRREMLFKRINSIKGREDFE